MLATPQYFRKITFFPVVFHRVIKIILYSFVLNVYEIFICMKTQGSRKLFRVGIIIKPYLYAKANYLIPSFYHTY